MKVDPEERILRCLAGEILDRVPHMELGFNVLPTVLLNLYFDKMPIKLQNWIRGLRLYENAVQASKEHLGLSKPVSRKPIIRRLFQIDRIASGLVSFPTSLNFMTALNPFLFRIPIRFGIDMIPTQAYPSIIVRGKVRRHGKTFFISEDWALIDVDDIGDVRSNEPFYSPEKQMEALIEAYHKDTLNAKIEYLGNLQKSVRGKLALTPIFNGIFESWHIVWGLSNMHLFFRDFMKEYRKGSPYGPYKRYLTEKSKFYAEFVRRLAEKDIKFVTLVEDVCEDNGPFLKTDQYVNFYVPEIKRICDAAHRVGIKVLFHTDGRFKIQNSESPWSFLDAILSTGIDMLHGCQQDCNNLKELKEYVGSKVTLVGGISCVDVLQHAKSAKELYLRAGRAIETLKQGGYYITAADNGFHSGVNPENIRWYLNAIRYYGKY